MKNSLTPDQYKIIHAAVFSGMGGHQIYDGSLPEDQRITHDFGSHGRDPQAFAMKVSDIPHAIINEDVNEEVPLMSYQTTYPVEVGTFGQFKHGGKKLVETWIALEDLCYEHDWWVGIYSKWNLLNWAKTKRLLTPEEIAMFEAAF